MANVIASDGTINPHCGKCKFLRRAKNVKEGWGIFLEHIHAYYCNNSEDNGRWWSGRPTFDCCRNFKHR